MGWFTFSWTSLLFPLVYVGILGGALVTFSSIQRKRKAAKSASLEPWFPPHLQRNVYLSLLHLEGDDGPGEKKGPKVPESVIRAALLRRAVESLRRMMVIRKAGGACQALLQRGSVSDDLFQRFQRAEHEINEELRDVVMEANALAPGWGQMIFQTANELGGNEFLRRRLDAKQALAGPETEWWAPIAAQKQTEEGSKKAAANGGPVAVENKPVAAAAAGASSQTPSVDGDTVVVDSAQDPATPSGGKKKKGKK